MRASRVDTEIELQQKPQCIGRARKDLRAIRDFVDRHLTARSVVLVTILLLLASSVYPPWIIGSSRYISHGRLFLIDGIILAAGGLLAWAAFHNSKALRKAVHITVYSLLALPLLAIAGLLVAFLIQKSRKPFSRYDALLKSEPSKILQETLDKRFQPGSNAANALEGIRQARQEGYSDIEIYSYLMRNGFLVASTSAAAKPISSLRDIEELFSENASRVEPDDLRKITLFDVSPKKDYSMYSCNGFYGRVRNDLPRAVGKIGLKASFYNTQAELIGVWNFDLKNGPFEPGTSVSFNEYFAVEYLPNGWKYQLEVTEAHYRP